VKHVLRVAWRWGWRWVVVGLTLGVVMMFARVEFMAESGSHPDDLASFAFWIPLVGAVALVFGLASGLPFAILVMTLQKAALTATMSRGLFASLCGAAGGIVASLIFLLEPESYLVALAVLMATGAVSGWLLRNRLT